MLFFKEGVKIIIWFGIFKIISW